MRTGGRLATTSVPLRRLIPLSWTLLLVGIPARAQPSAPNLNSGDTAWMLVSSALVLLMTPGLALFYGGMVRRKNVLATFMYSYLALALITVQWVVFGYSITFGQTHSGLIGGLEYLLLSPLVFQLKGTLPHLAFVAFQLKFAINSGADFRGLRRADEIQRLLPVSPALEHLGLRPGCPLDLGGRRMDGQFWSARLRRGHGGALERGSLRVDLRLVHRKTARLRPRALHSP